MGDVAGLGRRARLDTGTLGVVGVRVANAREAIQLVRRGHGKGLTVLTADEVTVDADAPEIPVGIDGESVVMPTPVHCTIQPTGAPRGRAQGASRRSRSQAVPRLGAALATRIIPCPGRR